MVVAIGLLTLLVGSMARVRVNFTESLPIGLYRITEGPIVRGAIVLACLPAEAARFARERGYLWRGDCPGAAAPIGKLVLATEGDVVGVSKFGLSVNGRLIAHTKPSSADSRGRPIPHYAFGVYTVKRSDVWLYSPHHPLSYDSRYFGPIRTSNVKARLRPWWTLVACCGASRNECSACPTTRSLARRRFNRALRVAGTSG